MNFRPKKKPQELTAFAQKWRAEYETIKDAPAFLDWVVKFMEDNDLSALPQKLRQLGRVPLNLGPPPKQKNAEIYKELARRKDIYDYLVHKRKMDPREARRIAFQNIDEVTTNRVIFEINQWRQVREALKRRREKRAKRLNEKAFASYR